MSAAPEEDQGVVEALDFDPECYPHRRNYDTEVLADWWIKGMRPCCDRTPVDMFICGPCLAKALVSYAICTKCRKWYAFAHSVIEYRRLKP